MRMEFNFAKLSDMFKRSDMFKSTLELPLHKEGAGYIAGTALNIIRSSFQERPSTGVQTRKHEISSSALAGMPFSRPYLEKLLETNQNDRRHFPRV